MKCIIAPALLMLLILHGTPGLQAQNVRINTDGSAADASALLDIKSNDKGILLPSMTATQRSAIVNPVPGLLVFQTDGLTGFCYYDGVQWVSLFNGKPITNNGYSSTYGMVSTYSGSIAGHKDTALNFARFDQPSGVTVDPACNIFVLDYQVYNVRKITANGFPRVITLAGGGLTGYKDDTATKARFSYPLGITADAFFNVYVADTYNNCIRKISQDSVVTTLAGQLSAGFVDGTGAAATFYNPVGIVADRAGNLYVSEWGNHSIRKITPNGTVTTIAGFSGAGYDDGPGNIALFRSPAGLAMDASDNLYIADMDNHRIRKMTPAGIVSTYAGTGVAGNTDGTASTCTFDAPMGIAVDRNGNVYVSDVVNFVIRKISPDGLVTTIAGNGTAGNANGLGSAARFGFCGGLAIDKDGNLLVADRDNHSVRKIILQ